MLYVVYAVLSVCCTRFMLYSVFTLLGVCSTWCMLYSAYTVLGINSRLMHGAIESDDLTSWFQVMVELSTRKREMRGYRGNHHQKLGLKRISCLIQFTISYTAGRSPVLESNYTDGRSSQPNEASRTPDFSYPLSSCTSFSSSSPISLFLFHNSTIIRDHKVQSSLSFSLWHDHELTPSTAYTQYSIHRVQHPPMIDCLPFILMITSWPRNVASASCMPPYTIDRH